MRRAKQTPLAVALALCLCCAPHAGASSRTEALAAESENRRLKDEIETTERAMLELVRLANSRGIELEDLEVRGHGLEFARRTQDVESNSGGGAPEATPRRAAEAEEEETPAAVDEEHVVEAKAEREAAGEEKEEAEGGEEGAEGEEEGEEGEEGEEAEAEEAEEVEEEACDLDTSIMLLGMISFVMILFYLTNWPDDDIRLYSWQITSTTISIFCSVLLFQGFNKFLIKRLVQGVMGLHPDSPNWPWMMTVFQFLHCFVYLACIHFGTGITSGSLCRSPGLELQINESVWVYSDALRSNNNTPVKQEDLQYIRAVKRAGGPEKCTETTSVFVKEKTGEEIPVQKKKHTMLQRKRETKALGMLFAHLAGFAAIYSGKALQQLLIPLNQQGCSAPWHLKLIAWLPVIVNQAVLRIAFMLSNKLREYQLNQLSSTDETSPEAKEGLESIRELMKEEVEESENDVSSLSMSFLIVNVVIFCITDFLPTDEAEPQVCRNGQESPMDIAHGLPSVLALYLVGFLMVGVAVLQAVAMAMNHHSLENNQALARVCEAVLNATGMCFAWCLIWATKWLAKMFSDLDENKEDWSNDLFSHEIMGRVLLAFMLTSFAAVSVFAVDKIADTMRDIHAEDVETVRFVEEIIRVIINSLGILVGFSWEHSFDGSVEDVAATTHFALMPSAEFQLFLGIGVCVLILPAWRDHMLEKVMLIEGMLKKKRGMEIVAPHEGHEGEEHKNAH